MRIMTLKKAELEFRVSTPWASEMVLFTRVIFESTPAHASKNEQRRKATIDKSGVRVGQPSRFTTPVKFANMRLRRRHSARGSNYIRSRATVFDYCFVNPSGGRPTNFCAHAPSRWTAQCRRPRTKSINNCFSISFTQPCRQPLLNGVKQFAP